MLDIIRLYDSKTKKTVARGILEALPEWFGIAEAREEYNTLHKAPPSHFGAPMTAISR